MTFLVILMIFFAFSALGVLVSGICLMAFGGKINQKYSNMLMTLRVISQASAIIILGLIFMISN